MLIYSFERLYYSRELAWGCALAVPLGAAAVVAVCGLAAQPSDRILGGGAPLPQLFQL